MPESVREVVPQLAEADALSDVWVGFWLPLKALRLIFSTPRLLGLALLASAVTAAALVSVLVFSWPLSRAITERLVGGEGAWSTTAQVLLAVFLYLTLVVALALTVPSLMLAPLQDPLSEATEARCGDFEGRVFSVRGAARGAVVAFAHTFSRLGLLLVGFVALLPLNLLPGVGSILYALVSALWAMWWMTAEYLSGPMARHLMPFRSVLSAMRRRIGASIGFGAALYVLLWVPVLNFFLVPVAVVGGTLLFRAFKARAVV